MVSVSVWAAPGDLRYHASMPTPPNESSSGALSRAGSFAKVYGADNTTLGFQAILTAVAIAAAGLDGIVAYTVLPNADVGQCVDIDLPRGLDHATQSTLKAIVARDGNVHAALEGDELEAALQGFGPRHTEWQPLYHEIKP
jgi:hypothetical protein